MRLFRNKYLVLIFCLVCLLGMSLFLGLRQEKIDIDDYPEETTAIDIYKQANLVDKSATIAKKLGGVTQYDLLTEDIYYFGKTTYESYRKGTKKIIGFEITSDITTKDKTVSFDGKYGSSDNLVSISVELLDNKRIKSSISDTYLNKNIDDQLPSNSKLNQFISELPISKNKYIIEYSPPDDMVVIQLNERDSSIYSSALLYIKNRVNDGSFDDQRVMTIFPPDSFGI